MKRLITLFLVMVMALSFSFGLVGCNNDDGGDGELSRAEISAIYKEAAKSVWAMLGKDDPTVGASAMKVEIPNLTTEITAESDKQVYIHNLNVTTLFVNFVGDLYANENFVITDKVVTFGASVTHYGMTLDYTLSMAAEIDKENDNIYVELSMSMAGVDSCTYNVINIDYDFDQKIATGFRLIYYEFSEETVYVFNDQIYTADGKCYYSGSGNLEDYQSALDAFVDDFEQRKEDGVVIEERFDEEFQTVNDLVAALSSQSV